jgi:hypothetical protein
MWKLPKYIYTYPTRLTFQEDNNNLKIISPTYNINEISEKT